VPQVPDVICCSLPLLVVVAAVVRHSPAAAALPLVAVDISREHEAHTSARFIVIDQSLQEL
jgi:uncharacterized membrane protein YdfJ with MMPL/SSD domain